MSRSKLNIAKLEQEFDKLLNSYTREEINEWAISEGLTPLPMGGTIEG